MASLQPFGTPFELLDEMLLNAWIISSRLLGPQMYSVEYFLKQILIIIALEAAPRLNMRKSHDIIILKI